MSFYVNEVVSKPTKWKKNLLNGGDFIIIPSTPARRSKIHDKYSVYHKRKQTCNKMKIFLFSLCTQLHIKLIRSFLLLHCPIVRLLCMVVQATSIINDLFADMMFSDQTLETFSFLSLMRLKAFCTGAQWFWHSWRAECCIYEKEVRPMKKRRGRDDKEKRQGDRKTRGLNKRGLIENRHGGALEGNRR